MTGSGDDILFPVVRKVNTWILGSSPLGVFPKPFERFVSNPNKVSFWLCEAYGWRNMLNEQIITASLTKQFLVQI